jgi:fibrillarin-like pre-rRNA processing protein
MKNLVIKREDGIQILTRNLTPGITYYKEKLVKVGEEEYRVWSPYRSKLAAALAKGLEPSILEGINKILYLGAATGTTVSHLSDLYPEGLIYAVEVAPRVMMEFINRVIKYRKNIVPLYFDARNPKLYSDVVDKVDLLYCDIAQPDQTEIAAYNSDIFLKKGGKMLLAVKSRSIDVTREPRDIYMEEAKYLDKRGFNIINVIDLDPYEKDHAMIYAIKK